MNQEKYLKWVLVLAVLTTSFSLGGRALWDPDESRYAEIAREILVLNDWVTPHLNFLPYFEKPMLFMWLEAISFKLFGVSETSAHIMPLLTGLAGTALTGLLAWKLWGRRAGLVAALILATSFQYFFLTCAVDINMPLTLFITGAMVFFWIGHMEKKPWYLYAAWVSMALAFLTKGPIGLVLPAGAVFLFILFSRRFRLIWESRPISGFLLFLAVLLPWYILVSMRNPEFFSFFFLNQNFQRFTASPEHNRPLYYFVPMILAGALPWTFLLPAAVKALRKRPMPEEILYLLMWFSLIFLFFSFSKSKLGTYILPCFPPLALILAYPFKERAEIGSPELYAAGTLWGVLGILLLSLQPLVSHDIVHLSDTAAPLLKVSPVLGLVVLSGMIAGFVLGKSHDIILGMSALSLSLMLGTVLAAPQWDAFRSTRDLVAALPPAARVCSYNNYFHSSTFYTKKQVTLVNYKGELDFGIDHNTKQGVYITLDELAALMKQDKNIYCLTNPDNTARLRRMIPDIKIVRESSKVCLLNVP